MNKRENLIAAKLLVYPGDEEEYYTFMTPEAYNSCKGMDGFSLLLMVKI